LSATSKRKITFSVDGRPPRKYRNKSIWSSKQEAPLVKKLREHALKERNNKKLGECFYGKIEMNLKIFSNKRLILDETATHDHIGDLDAFIAGIFESLQPAHKQALKFLDPIFKKDEVFPDKPILFKNDSQIVKIKAEKLKSNKPHYVVSISEK